MGRYEDLDSPSGVTSLYFFKTKFILLFCHKLPTAFVAMAKTLLFLGMYKSKSVSFHCALNRLISLVSIDETRGLSDL